MFLGELTNLILPLNVSLTSISVNLVLLAAPITIIPGFSTNRIGSVNSKLVRAPSIFKTT